MLQDAHPVSFSCQIFYHVLLISSKADQIPSFVSISSNSLMKSVLLQNEALSVSEPLEEQKVSLWRPLSALTEAVVPASFICSHLLLTAVLMTSRPEADVRANETISL